MSKEVSEISRWRDLGWKNPFWELVRYYCSLRGKVQKGFFEELSGERTPTSTMALLGLDSTTSLNLAQYIKFRELRLAAMISQLRNEEEAQEFCKSNKVVWEFTRTKNKGHHQSSKSMIATVSYIASAICDQFGVGIEKNPQRRCVWNENGNLHVSARNLDGAVPGLQNPFIVWEIKEYWGKTNGGSKMSDAVYECHLVGKEIRECEERGALPITHVVFLDGRDQWLSRKSDLARFIDLESQGLVDFLIVGRQVETDWEGILGATIQKNIMNIS